MGISVLPISTVSNVGIVHLYFRQHICSTLTVHRDSAGERIGGEDGYFKELDFELGNSHLLLFAEGIKGWADRLREAGGQAAGVLQAWYRWAFVKLRLEMGMLWSPTAVRAFA